MPLSHSVFLSVSVEVASTDQEPCNKADRKSSKSPRKDLWAKPASPQKDLEKTSKSPRKDYRSLQEAYEKPMKSLCENPKKPSKSLQKAT